MRCDDRVIEELAFKLPINNIKNISYWLDSDNKDKVKKYKVKLVKQFLKLMEEEICNQ